MKTKLWMTLLKFLVMTLLICSLANAQESGPIKVGLTLSGGGVRAAAFSYGVMRGLDEINVCVNNNYKEVGIGIRYFAKPVNSSKLLTEPRDAKCKKQGFTTISVLSAINYLSAVSGGSITASYYMTHDDEEFKEEFRDLLGDLNVTWDIVKNMESRLHLGGTGFGEKLPLSIALLLTSAIDTAKNIAFAPFAWMLRSNDWEMPFINSDLTPPMFLAASRGLISVKRWQETYEDWIFDGNELTFNDILEERSNITLLIHATDIKNRRPFTFDEWTFKCLGISKMGYQNFPIALAAAASSALPVLFEPLKLNKYLDENFEEFRRVDAIPPTCPRIIQDKTERRTPELLDGGLQENLGLAGLIRTVFREKSKKLQSVQTKNFIIVVNSAAPGVEPFPHIGTDPSTMLNNIDQSIDNLQREKTDFARSTYQGPLNNFGFASLEVNFSDITKDPNLVKRIAMLINESGGGASREKINEALEYSDSFTDFERRVRKDLETIGMKPLKEDIDTLIAAGRSIIHKKKDELIGTLVNLSKRKFVNDCDEIINATKFDCWPENFKILPNILDKRLGVILKEFSDTTQRFIKKTTEKRINGIRNVQRKALKIKKELELSSKIYKVRGQILKKIKKEIDYYSLLTDRESVEITENLEKFRKLFDQDQPTFFEEAFHKSIKSLVKYKNKAGADIPLDELDYHIDPEEIYLKSHILPALDTLGTVLTGEPIQDCRSFYRIPETKAIDMASQNNLKKTKVDLVLNGKEIYCYAAENLLKEIEKRRGEEDPAVNNPMVYYYAAVLSHFLDRNDEAFYNLYAGIKSFPQVANLHGLLGYLAFLVDGNAEKAISQYNLAIEIAKARQSQLRFLKFQSHDVEDLQRIRKVKERFQYQENWNKRQLAEYLALIPGYSGFCGALCKDFEIWWEENSSKLEDTDREVPVSFLDNVEDFSNDRSIAQERKIDDGNSNAFFAKNAQDVAIEEKQESKEAVEKTDGGLSEISKYHKRSPILEFYKNDELDEEYRKIGVHFAEEIFYKYFKKAKEPLNQNDSEIQEPIPGLMHHEILYPYALHSLINSAQYECPDRRFGILKSRELLIYSISRLLDSIQILVINNEIFELKGNSSEITDRREVFENKVIDFKNDLLELNETKFQEFAESIFPKARELWVTKVAEKIKKGGKVEQAEILKDVIVLFFDLKYLTYFLGYVDELECLGA